MPEFVWLSNGFRVSFHMIEGDLQMKKRLCILLSALLLIGMLPVSVFASETSRTGLTDGSGARVATKATLIIWNCDNQRNHSGYFSKLLFTCYNNNPILHECIWPCNGNKWYWIWICRGIDFHYSGDFCIIFSQCNQFNFWQLGHYVKCCSIKRE